MSISDIVSSLVRPLNAEKPVLYHPLACPSTSAIRESFNYFDPVSKGRILAFYAKFSERQYECCENNVDIYS